MNIDSQTNKAIPYRRTMCLSRDKRGTALSFVMSFGVLVALSMTAMIAMVMPTYQKAASGRALTAALNAAESALDFVVSDLIEAKNNGTTSSYDDPTPGTSLDKNEAKITTVSGSLVGVPEANITVRVWNIAPTPDSSIYILNQPPGDNPWRVVQANARVGMSDRTISVVLKPQYKPIPISEEKESINPFVSTLTAGEGGMTLSGNVKTYDDLSIPGQGRASPRKDRKNGDVATLGTLNMSGNTNIGGSIKVDSRGIGDGATTVFSSGNVEVNGTITTNGSFSGSATVHGVPGHGEPAPARNLDGQHLYIYEQADVGIPDLPPAPGIPPDSEVVSAQITGGSTKTVAQPGSNQVANLGSVSVQGNNTLKIPPGDYIASQLMVQGNGRIELIPGANGTYGPVRIFLQGTTGGNDVLQIAGNGITNMQNVPANLQFYYGGSKNIKVAGNGNLTAVIYAPNATAQLAGNGEFFGSLVAYQINAHGNGVYTYDRNLSNGQIQILGKKSVLTTTSQVSGYRTVTWKEEMVR